jgi:hypothetical protein
MSLEQFLKNDTFCIAAAYALMNLAILVAPKEKQKKYEELQEELVMLIDKYHVTDDELFGANCDLGGEQPSMPDEEEIMERADKLLAHENGWGIMF